MQMDFQSEKPIYMQIASEMENAIFISAFAEEEQVPSTTELSTRLKINPATVMKGMNVLVERGILYKKRGVGMFVKEGAVDRIRKDRQARFFENYVAHTLEEARRLGLTLEELTALVERGYENEQN